MTYNVKEEHKILLTEVCGASGGASYPSDTLGGYGGCISCVINVSQYKTLYIFLGGSGGTPQGGWNGGGNGSLPLGEVVIDGIFLPGGSAGGGGGGASEIRTSPLSKSNMSSMNNILVVGGTIFSFLAS